MSVLIGMEMPIDGNETIIRIQPDGTVLDQYGHHLAITAVPVPTPHGDLIDRDAERLDDEIFKLRVFKSRFDIKEMLDAAPVIVPKEN